MFLWKATDTVFLPWRVDVLLDAIQGRTEALLLRIRDFLNSTKGLKETSHWMCWLSYTELSGLTVLGQQMYTVRLTQRSFSAHYSVSGAWESSTALCKNGVGTPLYRMLASQAKKWFSERDRHRAGFGKMSIVP